ncbi:MAG: MBL fold metallo-hydrolase [Lachnospiraceae bacterium]|nr:MBL fold metallo-hydrolase [Lachnospiraceae bacterium]
MKITYLYHSGFAVELAQHILIFDYYRGKLPKWDKNKTILFFVSHKHQDHFDLRIFDCFGQYEKLHYFLGSDVKLSEAYLKRNGVSPAVKSAVTNVGKNTVTKWQDITVETLRSTDAGVAFIVTAEDKTFYHAGDLNWWHWEGEDAAWNRQMEADYKKEIARIKGRHFDAAFVPLDPRLEGAYDLGMRVFLEHTDAGAVFPMHMWDRYEVIDRFLQSKAGAPYQGRIMKIKEPGQEFIV